MNITVHSFTWYQRPRYFVTFKEGTVSMPKAQLKNTATRITVYFMSTSEGQRHKMSDVCSATCVNKTKYMLPKGLHETSFLNIVTWQCVTVVRPASRSIVFNLVGHSHRWSSCWRRRNKRNRKACDFSETFRVTWRHLGIYSAITRPLSYRFHL